VASLTNPVTRQNIVDRFADYVQATANAGIVWYNNGPGAIVEPFPEFDQTLLASSNGKAIEINGDSLGGAASRITASTIYNALVAETNRYTRIRSLRARLLITAPGGAGNKTREANSGFDDTQIAHLSSAYQADIGSPANGGVVSPQTISATNLETFFNTLRTAYNTARATATQIDVSVCHSSCHVSCHSSRGRR
jgi:hypothetical protein